MDNLSKLQQIKEQVGNQMIFLQGYIENVNFTDEVEWLMVKNETS